MLLDEQVPTLEDLFPNNQKENQTQQAQFFLATVDSVSSTGLTIIPDWQTTATQKRCKTMASAYPNPAVGDRVVVMKMSGTYVVLGALTAGEVESILPISKGGTGQSGIYKTNDASEILVANSGFTVVTAEYAQYGKVAMLRCQVTPDSAHTTASMLTPATLVSGKRPVYQAMMGMYNTDVGYISTNGDLNVYGTMSLTTGRYGLYSTYLLP